MLDASLAARIERLSIPEPNSGCWIWLGAVSDANTVHQRAKIRFGRPGMPAARAAYEAYCGPIPEGKHVLHRCDTPLCVNPAHLWVGTHTDNMRDMHRKGRAVVGGSARRMAHAMRGVYLCRSGNFRAQIRLGGKCTHLGTFDSADAARAAIAKATGAEA